VDGTVVEVQTQTFKSVEDAKNNGYTVDYLPQQQTY